MKSIIIAEAGVNHNGSVKLAKQMIDQQKQEQTISNFRHLNRKSWFPNMRRKQIIRRKRQAIMNHSYRCWKNWHCHMMILWN